MAIYDLTKQQVVDYLADFEEKLPNIGVVFYQPSYDFNPTNHQSLNVEAIRIIQFLGINDHTINIDYENLSERKASGMAHLEGLTQKVFHITIDPGILQDKSTTLRVLAHEICHLFLKLKGIFTGFEKIDEASAELCTIYMGLGLLTLNGYKESSGYLNLEDFCHAFCVVYRSRGMSDEEIKRIVPQPCKYWVDIILHDMTELQSTSMRELVITSQISDYNFRRRVKILQLLLDNMPEIKEKHNLQDGMFKNRQTQLKDGKHPIQEMLLRETIVEYNLFDHRLDKCCEEMDKLIDFMCSTMKIDLEKVSEGITKDITCPSCGHISEKKRVNDLSVLKCPNCHHLFAWDGSPVNIPMTKGTIFNDNDSFWDRLRHLGKSN